MDTSEGGCGGRGGICLSLVGKQPKHYINVTTYVHKTPKKTFLECLPMKFSMSCSVYTYPGCYKLPNIWKLETANHQGSDTKKYQDSAQLGHTTPINGFPSKQ